MGTPQYSCLLSACLGQVLWHDHQSSVTAYRSSSHRQEPEAQRQTHLPQAAQPKWEAATTLAPLLHRILLPVTCFVGFGQESTCRAPGAEAAREESCWGEERLPQRGLRGCGRSVRGRGSRRRAPAVTRAVGGSESPAPGRIQADAAEGTMLPKGLFHAQGWQQLASARALVSGTEAVSGGQGWLW